MAATETLSDSRFPLWEQRIAVANVSSREPVEPPQISDRPPAVSVRSGASLTHGSRRAVVDNVILWMSQPAMLRGDGTVAAAPADQHATLDPLLRPGKAVRRPGVPVRVMLDPGHGGLDPGALTPCRRYRESALVLDIAQRTALHLMRAGVAVRLSRSDDDTTLTLEERVAGAIRWQADLLISIHLNSAGNASARGLETFALAPRGMRATAQVDWAEMPVDAVARMQRAYPGNAQDASNVRLAFCLQRRILQRTGLPDRGVRRARYALLRDAPMAAALVEAGFLSSREDATLLLTSAGRERIARGIAQGVLDYVHGEYGSRELVP